MELFYTDKGKTFECQIQVEGADINETTARLVLMFENKRNLIFFGDVNADGTCEIKVPALKELKESKGTAVLEVISESTFFEPWESEFELKTSKKVTVEVKSSNAKPLRENKTKDEKPKVSVIKSSLDNTPDDKNLSENLKQKFKPK